MFLPRWLYPIQRYLFSLKSQNPRNVRRRVPAPHRVRLFLEGLEERLTPSVLTPINNDTPAAFGQINPNAAPATTTTASDATAPFSTSDQTVTLNATVTSGGNAVTEGTVTFTVLQGTRVIGTATPGTVNSSGQASADYTLPGGTDAGTYTIDASYHDNSGAFADSSDNTHTLKVTSSTAAATTTAASNATATFGAQNVTLTANVASNNNPVTEGTVFFTILKGSTVIGTATSGPVNSSGQANVSYALPAGTAVGSYTIEADYTDSTGAFAASSDTSHTLTVNAASTTTAASNATATFSANPQAVTLNATVTSSAGTVNEGSVQFKVLQGSTVIGTATSSSVNSSGQATASYALPAGTPAGTYTIEANYSDNAGNFATSSDNTHKLTVAGASTTTSASNATANFSSSDQDVTLNATVTSSAGTVNEGTVTFTLFDNVNGNTIGSATTSSTVSNGGASVSYLLPAGTPAGSYTINAVYNPGTDFSGSSDSTHSLTVGASNSTSLSLSAVSITPNLANGTAQVTLTAHVTNPGGTVGEGVVKVTMGGVSATGNLVNGLTIVNLTVPLQVVIDNPSVSLAYTDTATPASFADSSTSRTLFLNAWSGVLPSKLSFAADGTELIQLQAGGQTVLGYAYSPVGLLLQINVSSVTLPVTYTHTSSDVLVTIGGLPWQLNFFNSTGQFQGLISLAFASDGSPEWLMYNSSGQITGSTPV